jgi:hypothetical protein
MMALPTVEELADEIHALLNGPADGRTDALIELIENAYREGYSDRQIDEDTEVFARAVSALLVLAKRVARPVTKFSTEFPKDELQAVLNLLSDVVKAKTEL